MFVDSNIIPMIFGIYITNSNNYWRKELNTEWGKYMCGNSYWRAESANPFV